MKARIFAALLSLSMASQAFAGCWMECIGVKINGQCIGGKTKVCNWEGYKEDLDRVGKDIESFGNHLDQEWKNIYRKSLPENVRKAINSTSIFLVSAYYLGVDPSVIGGVLAVVVTRSVLRAEKGKAVHTPEKPWIAQLEEKGNQMIVETETQIALAYGGAEAIFRSRIDSESIWENYLGCLAGSSSQAQAVQACYLPLDKKLFELRQEIISQVVGSELG